MIAMISSFMLLILSLVSVSSLVMTTTRPLRRYGVMNSVVKRYNPLNDRSKQLLSSHYKHTFTSLTPLGMSGSADDDLSNVKNDSLYQTIGIVGVASNIVCDYSLYVLKTTGSGLPAGPYGLEGGLEGISYLAVVGIFIWSITTKVKTGSGLPAGPLGLLGTVCDTHDTDEVEDTYEDEEEDTDDDSAVDDVEADDAVVDTHTGSIDNMILFLLQRYRCSRGVGISHRTRWSSGRRT